MAVTFLTNEDKTELENKINSINSSSGEYYVTPQMFGAKGDGVTDDAVAIAQALASSKTVVFDGMKTYAVGSTITIPADANVDFRGATIVPMGNHDVIRVMPGSNIENLIVKCTDVPDWDSSVMVFYGGDFFRATNPTRISNAKLYNDVTYNDGFENTGNGLYVYVDEAGQFIEGLAIVDLLTHGFGKGVYIKGMDVSAENGNGKVAFIGANNFCRYWSFKDTYGIYIIGGHSLNRLTNNFFSDMNIQSDSYGGTKYGIYCAGSGVFANRFSGCLYDFFFMNKNDPIKAIYFGMETNNNHVDTDAGTVYDLGYVTDLGINNRVENTAWRGKIQIPNGYSGVGMIGNQDDILAFADKRMICTLESLDGEPRYGTLSDVFDPTPFRVLSYAETFSGTSDRKARITINFKKSVKEITNFILQFVRRCIPSTVKVTFYGDKEVRTVYDTNDNYNQVVVINPPMCDYSYDYESPVTNVAKIVVEIGGFSFIDSKGDGTIKEWALERIMATGSDATGNTWLRTDGGKIFGNVEYAENFGPVITGANGKKYMLTVSTDGALLPVEMPETEEEVPDVATLVPTMAAGPAWYDVDSSGMAQNELTSVTFNAAYEADGNEDASWFCDEDGVGNIVAFRTGTDVVIVPTTGSDKVRVNTNSKYMFANDGTNANFASLASIAGTDMWVADKNTEMNYICAKTPISAPISIPSGVTYMPYAFQNCSALTAPPELPEGMLSLLSAFIGCSQMQYLPDVPSTVTNMNYTFNGCTAATKAPSIIPTGVTTMESTFRGCNNISGTIEINAVKINNYAGCFHFAGSKTSGIVLTGSSPYLAELAATDANGKVTVAS